MTPRSAVVNEEVFLRFLGTVKTIANVVKSYTTSYVSHDELDAEAMYLLFRSLKRYNGCDAQFKGYLHQRIKLGLQDYVNARLGYKKKLNGGKHQPAKFLMATDMGKTWDKTIRGIKDQSSPTESPHRLFTKMASVLSERDAHIFLLRYRDGYSSPQIGEMKGLYKKTVPGILSKARAKVAESFTYEELTDVLFGE